MHRTAILALAALGALAARPAEAEQRFYTLCGSHAAAAANPALCEQAVAQVRAALERATPAPAFCPPPGLTRREQWLVVQTWMTARGPEDRPAQDLIGEALMEEFPCNGLTR